MKETVAKDKGKKWIVLGINLLLLMGGMIAILFSHPNMCVGEKYSAIDKELFLQKADTSLEAGNYYDVSYSDINRIVSSDFMLEKGVYYFTVNYNATENVKAGINYVNPRYGKENVVEIPLNKSKASATTRLYVADTCQVNFYARLTGDAWEGNYVNITDFSVEKSSLSLVRQISSLFFLVLLFNIILLLSLYYKKISSKTDQAVFLGLFVVAFILGFPIYKTKLYGAVDLPFHLMRIEGLFHGLKSGQFPVKMQPVWLNGYGYGVSIFYGDILLYIPAILRLLGFSLSEAYKCFLMVVQIATVFVSYHCFKKIENSSLIAFLGTILYCGSIHRLNCIYYAAQVGTISAMIFYPIVLVGIYQLLVLDYHDKSFKSTWIYLVVGCSGLLQTHMISCFMFGLMIIVSACIFGRQLLNQNVLKEIGKALLVGILLNLWFIIPFLQCFFGDLRVNVIPEQIDYASYLSKYKGEGCNFATLFTEEGIGYPLAAVFLLTVILIPYYFKKIKKEHIYFLLIAILAMVLSMNILPYDKIAKIHPVILTYFHTIQYADRFLGMAVLFLSAWACVFLGKLTTKKQYLYGVVGLFCCFGIYNSIEYLETIEPDKVYEDVCHLEGNTTGNGEFIPDGTKMEELTDALLYAEDKVNVPEWEKEYLTVRVCAQNTDKDIQTIDMPLLYYPVYAARDDNTEEELAIEKGTNNRVAVILPAEYEGAFTVSYKEPWIWRICEWLSLLTLLGVCVYVILHNKAVKKKVSSLCAKISK